MSRSNVVGAKLASEVAPKIILQEEGLDPTALRKKRIPDLRTGIEFDLVDEKCANVFWVTHVTRGHFNKNFQKNVGELLFLKIHCPEARCGVVLGKIPGKYRPEYEMAYRLLWDAVYVVERKQGNWVYPSAEISVPDETSKQVASEIFQKQIAKIGRVADIPNRTRFCSLPSLIGSSGLSLVQSVFEKAISLGVKDLTTRIVGSVFEELIEEWKKQEIKDEELKSLVNGLTVDLIFESINGLLMFLSQNYAHYTISKVFQSRDWDRLLKLFPPYNQSSKFWDYYNPAEYLVEKTIRSVVDNHQDKVQKIKGCPLGFPLSTFLSDLGLNIRFKEDIGIELRGGKNIVVQVKALAGGKGASGPKQAGYEAHRMAGLSFVTRWGYNRSTGDIYEKSLDKVVVLDGYWKGPKDYPAKTFDYLYKFACVKDLFLIDEINQLKECLRQLLNSL
jgi:hypothetical protein